MLRHTQGVCTPKRPLPPTMMLAEVVALEPCDVAAADALVHTSVRRLSCGRNTRLPLLGRMLVGGWRSSGHQSACIPCLAVSCCHAFVSRYTYSSPHPARKHASFETAQGGSTSGPRAGSARSLQGGPATVELGGLGLKTSVPLNWLMVDFVRVGLVVPPLGCAIIVYFACFFSL